MIDVKLDDRSYTLEDLDADVVAGALGPEVLDVLTSDWLETVFEFGPLVRLDDKGDLP